MTIINEVDLTDVTSGSPPEPHRWMRTEAEIAADPLGFTLQTSGTWPAREAIPFTHWEESTVAAPKWWVVDEMMVSTMLAVDALSVEQLQDVLDWHAVRDRALLLTACRNRKITYVWKETLQPVKP